MADEGGIWRTISGRRVFIRDGQSLTDAMKESGKFEPEKSQKTIKGQYKETENMNEYDYFSKEQEQFRLNAIKELSGCNDEEAKQMLNALCGDSSEYLRVANAGGYYNGNAWFCGHDTEIRQANGGADLETAKTIDRYIESAPKYEGAIYRGMALDKESIKALSVGAVFKENGNLSSWTSKQDAGVMFAQGRSEETGKTPVILRSTNPPHGTPVGHLSIFGSEESEVLVSNMHGGNYVVKAVEVNDGITYIDLEYRR